MGDHQSEPMDDWGSPSSAAGAPAIDEDWGESVPVATPTTEPLGPDRPAPTPAGDAPRPVPVPGPDRHVSVWLDADAAGGVMPLRVGARRVMNFKVGSVVDGSLLDPDAAEIPDGDVPEGGLATEWLVTSDDVELAAADPGTSIDVVTLDGRTTHAARFGLVVPHRGESPVRRIWIVPRSHPVGGLKVTIFRRSEVYRQFDVPLPTSLARAGRAGCGG